MPDAILADPQRMAMWSRLAEAADGGIAAVHHWGLSDGLPVGTPTPAHQHTVPTLVLCLSGVVRVQGKAVLDLKPGELLLIEPGVWHDHVAHKPGCTSFGLGFLADRCDVLFFDHQQTLWGAVPQDPYRRLVEELMAASALSERLPLADEILAQVVHDRVNYVDWLQPAVLEMAAYLWNHLHEPIHADAVVAHSSLGRTQSFALFKSFFGRSPKQELLAQRLALARHLIRRGLSVTEAASRSGFPGRADLTRAHRRAFGVPPTSAQD